ncbi:MAG TPA: PDZ domain-containing protein, partial [Gemmataceae bacterium]|nr:PDZ domain-containing protein [Gemmataceae bacterium]
AEELPRQQRIADLERQIADLTRQLEELKREEAKNPAPPSFPDAWARAMHWRCIGPAAMGGRIVAVSVFEADPSVYWIATASGGLLKTGNNGITFEHQFEREATVSIGDVCVAPSNKDIVWVGTGEANPRNSVSYGDGVYKSIDGGKTWKHMGLRQSFQIGRIAIHPKNPDIVYVGALGRLYGRNQERGLFKTADGGKTWSRVLYVDDRTGVIDVAMNPKDPETLLVAAYDRQRDGFDTYTSEKPQPDGYDPYDPVRKWGPGAGIYKTTDGGKTFKKLTKGLPTVQMGRIGLDYYRKNPKTVFAIIETEKIGTGPQGAPTGPAGGGYLGVMAADADAGARILRVFEQSPADKAGLKPGDIILSVDNQLVLAYGQLQERLRPHKPGDKITVKVSRNRQSKDFTLILGRRPAGRPGEGGRPANVTRPFGFFLSGQRENVQSQQGPAGFQTGGVYKSTDGGDSWTRVNSVNPRPMYFSQVRVDPTDDKYVYVLGFVIYRSHDGGKTFQPDGSREVHPDQHALWIDPHDGRHMIVGCDGGFYATYDRMETWDFLNTMAIGQFYHVALDTRAPYHVYGGLQDNGSWGGPSQSLDGPGPVNPDWITVGGGDGFVCRVDQSDPDLVYCESQDGNIFRRNLRTGQAAQMRYPTRKVPRFQVDPRLSALLGLLRLPSVAAGLRQATVEVPYRFNWNTPFILSSHNPRIFYSAGNFVFRSVNRGDNLRVISPEITRTKRGSGTALAESPRNPDVLYVGTDDGALWVTRDGGGKWEDITKKVVLPGPRWVASIEPSHFAEGRAYVVFDAHRSDDDEPYVYVTEDYGQTWKSLRANLPVGSSRVLREDIENPNLLFLGTEFAAWVSLDRGQSWVKLNNNLPTVAVHEFAIHPTAGEMVAATHGRSLWVLDIKPLRQMTPQVLKADAYLYEPNPAVQWRSEPGRGTMYGAGHRHFVGQNPPRGAVVYYSLTKPAAKSQLRIVDYAGKLVQELKAEAGPGLHKAVWDFTRRRQPPPGQGPPRIEPAGPGMYRVVLTVDGREMAQPVRVEPDPVVPNSIATPAGQSGLDKDMADPDKPDADADSIGA